MYWSSFTEEMATTPVLVVCMAGMVSVTLSDIR